MFFFARLSGWGGLDEVWILVIFTPNIAPHHDMAVTEKPNTTAPVDPSIAIRSQGNRSPFPHEGSVGSRDHGPPRIRGGGGNAPPPVVADPLAPRPPRAPELCGGVGAGVVPRHGPPVHLRHVHPGRPPHPLSAIRRPASEGPSPPHPRALPPPPPGRDASVPPTTVSCRELVRPPMVPSHRSSVM